MSADALESPPGWNLDHSSSRLPGLFFRKAAPAPARNSGLVVFNDALAVTLGLDPEIIRQPDQAARFTGNLLPPGANPIAQAYAGHQFSEAMHALGIPTTRSLAVATTGESVFLNDVLPGAVLTRVAACHTRVGTFQWAAAHEDRSTLEALADHTRRRHFPDLAEASHLDFFHASMERQAALVAKWFQVGFIHGVMNTDNMALSGETIDYGPCAFLDRYDPATVFSSIDHAGRYAYSAQPPIARWNLARLAEAMIPLLHDDGKKAVELANEALHQFEGIFQNHWLDGMRAKLGLSNEEADDRVLVQQLLDWMHAHKQDFTGTFRSLSTAAALDQPAFPDPAFAAWHAAWKARLSRQAEGPTEILHRMQRHNPRVIPRNHKVEEALNAATQHGDLSPFDKLLAAITQPFAEAGGDEFTTPPPAGSPRDQTFCGT